MNDTLDDRELDTYYRAIMRRLARPVKYSEDQPRDDFGRWTDSGLSTMPSSDPSTWTPPTPNPETGLYSYLRAEVFHTNDINLAVQMIQAGQLVELPDTRHVYTLLTKLAALAQEAKDLGEQAPAYDLCKVQVANTNIFCAGHVETPEHPRGIPRIAMPQFSGEAVAGSRAADLPKNAKGEVNVAAHFREYLGQLNVNTTELSMPAAHLRASQNELVGTKVAGMMLNEKFNPAGEAIFVSRDNYVIDGHHRWAAAVGRESATGSLGQFQMPVIKIDMPIAEVLHLANQWTKEFGLAPKAAKRWIEVLHKWEESQHPRDEAGQFTHAGGATEASDEFGRIPGLHDLPVHVDIPGLPVFHAAPAAVAKKILEEGLKRGDEWPAEIWDAATHELHIVSRPPSVYYTDSLKLAEDYGHRLPNTGVFGHAIVEFRLPDKAVGIMDEHDNKPGSHFNGHAFRLQQDIPAAYIVAVHVTGGNWREPYHRVTRSAGEQIGYAIIRIDFPATAGKLYDEALHPRDERGQWTDAEGSNLVEQLTKPDGGFSYNVLTHRSPTTGLILSPFEVRQQTIPVGQVRASDLYQYVRKNWDLLQQPGNHFGGWHNPEDGLVYLDVSVIVDSHAEAERVAREHDQIAYFNLATKETVKLKGVHHDGQTRAVSDRQQADASRHLRDDRSLDRSQADTGGTRGSRSPLRGRTQAHPLAKFSQDQPRDEQGRWTDAGAGETSGTHYFPDHVIATVQAEELKIREQPIEYGVFIDPRDGTVSASFTDGKPNYISLPNALIPGLQDKIFIHNHPSGNSLSKVDVLTAQRFGMLAIRAVAPGGSNYMLRRTGMSWPDNFQSTITDIEQRQYTEWRMAISTGVMDVLTAQATHYDALWQKVEKAFPGEIVYTKDLR